MDFRTSIDHYRYVVVYGTSNVSYRVNHVDIIEMILRIISLDNVWQCLPGITLIGTTHIAPIHLLHKRLVLLVCSPSLLFFLWCVVILHYLAVDNYAAHHLVNDGYYQPSRPWKRACQSLWWNQSVSSNYTVLVIPGVVISSEAHVPTVKTARAHRMFWKIRTWSQRFVR